MYLAYDEDVDATNYLGVTDVFNMLTKKNARLTIVLTDCCNSDYGATGDGTGATQRLRIKFRCSHYSGECIAWGGNSNGIQPVLQLLVDGGHAPGYGHRTILLSKSNATMGVGTGYEKDEHSECQYFPPPKYQPTKEYRFGRRRQG